MIVLALSPHPDDAEFGAGATIARFVREGHEVRSIAISDCRDGDAATDEARALCGEQDAAGAILGSLTDSAGFPRRVLPVHRQRVLDALIALRAAYAPDLVLCPSLADIHQDHQVVAAEAVRAFRGVTTWGYVLPWNCATVAVTHWQRVTREDVERKIAAIACYESQRDRPYSKPELVWAGARLAGLQAGCEFAEAFQIIRSVA